MPSAVSRAAAVQDGGMDAAGVDASTKTVRPRVVVVGPLPPPWHGGSVATAAVLRSRVVERCEVLHLDTSDRRGLENLGRADPMNVLLALVHAARMLWLLAARRPAGVYVPIAQNTLALLRDATFILPAFLLRRRVVLHIHGGGLRDYHDGAPAPMRWLLRVLLSRADRVIVLGETLRPMLDGLARAESVAVLPNGADDPFGTPPERSGRSRPLRVVYLGNLIRSKGFLDVMEAVILLRAEGRDVELELAGAFHDRADEAAADALAAQLGGAVRVHGVVGGEAKRDLLRRADVLAFPSYYANEGHPYVVIEAMAAALPVVATPHACLAETVVDGVTGRLVPPRQPSAIAAALRELEGDADLRLRLGAAGRRRYEERYSFETWSAGLDRILGEAFS